MRKPITGILDIMDLKLNNLASVKQFDDITLSLEIRQNARFIDLTDNTVSLAVTRQDRKVLEQKDNISVKNNIVTVKLYNEALSINGLVKFELHIKDKDGSISTATFSLLVEESMSPNNVENKEHISIVETLQAEIKELKEIISSAKKTTVEQSKDLIEIKEQNTKLQATLTQQDKDINQLKKQLGDTYITITK